MRGSFGSGSRSYEYGNCRFHAKGLVRILHRHALNSYWTKRLRRGMGGAVWVDCGGFELLDLASILIWYPWISGHSGWNSFLHTKGYRNVETQ